MLSKKLAITLVLILFSACQSENKLQAEDKGSLLNQVSVEAFDGQNRFDIHQNGEGNFIISKNLLSTTINNKYLLVVEKRGSIPSYRFIKWTGEESIISLPKLIAFPKEKRNKAYISGFLTKANIGGKNHFYSGIEPLNRVAKVHIFELDENNESTRDFFVESNSSGYFSAYVNPGNYRVEYGKMERFQLQNGENGIFLMSLMTMID